MTMTKKTCTEAILCNNSDDLNNRIFGLKEEGNLNLIQKRPNVISMETYLKFMPLHTSPMALQIINRNNDLIILYKTTQPDLHSYENQSVSGTFSFSYRCQMSSV